VEVDEILKSLANQAPSLVVLVALVGLFLKHIKEQAESQGKMLSEFREDIRENTKASMALVNVIQQKVQN
jgi:Sec-independent protein translocase protein TatA